MKKNVAIVDTKTKVLRFTFEDVEYVIDLKEGDLHDNWNSFEDKNGSIWDINFNWEDYVGQKPYFTIYPVLVNEDGSFPPDSTQWDDGISFKVKKIGNRDDYFKEVRFNYLFDSSSPLKFEVINENEEVVLKTKRGGRASDEVYLQAVKNNIKCYIVAIASNGARKKI